MDEVSLDGIGGRYLNLRRGSPPVERDVWIFSAEMTLPGVQAETLVAESGFGLRSYFRDLADSWRGFDGTKDYAALEGQLEITSHHDGKGTVLATITLRRHEPPEWHVEAVFEFGAGAHMERIAEAVEAFMTAPNSSSGT